jgi:hypothetical protein
MPVPTAKRRKDGARGLRLPRLCVNQRPLCVKGRAGGGDVTAGGRCEEVAPRDLLLWPVYCRGGVFRCFY